MFWLLSVITLRYCYFGVELPFYATFSKQDKCFSCTIWLMNKEQHDTCQ